MGIWLHALMCCALVQIHKHELRLRMDAAIGRAPPLSDFELQVTALCRPGTILQLPKLDGSTLMEPHE